MGWTQTGGHHLPCPYCLRWQDIHPAGVGAENPNQSDLEWCMRNCREEGREMKADGFVAASELKPLGVTDRRKAKIERKVKSHGIMRAFNGPEE